MLVLLYYVKGLSPKNTTELKNFLLYTDKKPCYSNYGISLSDIVAFHKNQERRIIMTFGNKVLKYRVALDTKKNLFMAIDANNQANIAYGITITQAVKELKKSI